MSLFVERTEKGDEHKITGMQCLLSSSSLANDVVRHCFKSSLMGFGCFFVSVPLYWAIYHESPVTHFSFTQNNKEIQKSKIKRASYLFNFIFRKQQRMHIFEASAAQNQVADTDEVFQFDKSLQVSTQVSVFVFFYLFMLVIHWLIMFTFHYGFRNSEIWGLSFIMLLITVK